MELFTKQHEGGPELEMIQQKVNSLKIEAARIGILPTSQAPRGRGGKLRGGRGRGFAGGWRGRGGKARGGAAGGVPASQAASRLDRRPSMILVSGYDGQAREELLDHFRKFGELVENQEEEVGWAGLARDCLCLDPYCCVLQGSQSIILKYKLRRSAETALATGNQHHQHKVTQFLTKQQTFRKSSG